MRFIPIKTPFFIRWFFPKYVWKKPTDEKTIYLTFDDGPTPEITAWVLDQLMKHNAKATFFCIGNNIESHPDLFKRIHSEGHSIGNHTKTHLKGWKSRLKDYLNDTEQAQSILEQNLLHANHLNQKLFRPPYGQIKKSQGRALIKNGYDIIMWSVLTFDWDKSLSKEDCLKNSLKAKSGDIVVFHDSIKASGNMQYALPHFLNYYSEKGYIFKEL